MEKKKNAVQKMRHPSKLKIKFMAKFLELLNSTLLTTKLAQNWYLNREHLNDRPCYLINRPKKYNPPIVAIETSAENPEF